MQNTPLATLQQHFHDFLRGKSMAIEPLIVGDTKELVQKRLKIYQEAYHLRLTENLRKQFPVLALWLKEQPFIALAQHYEAVYPPCDFAIRHYGTSLAHFLMNHAPYKEQPFLAELAAFEWALDVALDDAQELPLFTLQDMQKLSPEQLLNHCFTLHPSLHCLTFHHDIPTWWTQVKTRKKVKAPETLNTPLYCAAWRREWQAYYRVVDALEFELIQGAKEGAPFSGLCERILPYLHEEEPSARVASTVLHWLQDGWVSASYL